MCSSVSRVIEFLLWRDQNYLVRIFAKGQLISKCPFGFIVWTKIPTKLSLDFCPEFFFVASWGLSL